MDGSVRNGKETRITKLTYSMHVPLPCTSKRLEDWAEKSEKG